MKLQKSNFYNDRNSLNPNSFSLFFSVLCTLWFTSLGIFVATDGTKSWAAQEGTAYIPVGAAKTKKAILAFPEIRTKGLLAESATKIVAETITSDLNFMGQYTFLNSSAFIEESGTKGITPGSFDFKDWNKIGADFLLKSSLTIEPNDVIALETHVYDVAGGKQILEKRYVAPKTEAKILAHTFANDFVQTLTGLPGIFLTHIAMSCDMTHKKEIYVMNFDGTEAKQVTHHRSIAFAPAWSPDGTRIAYSLFNKHKGNVKNIDLYEFNLLQNTVRMLSNKNGMNSGAAYSPDGTKIALTLSESGTPAIYLLDPITRELNRLTRSFAFDVDPSWSPDGKSIAFVSSRTGMPMLFTMTANGQNIQRLTYAGQFNATPSWSPQGKKIAFAGWLDKSFDIFTMNSDGTHIERLTKNQRGNEDPFFSPDGNFIAFSSNRTGQKNIYVMNTDGSFVKRLTYGMGNCVSPKWSSPPKPLPTVEDPALPVSKN